MLPEVLVCLATVALLAAAIRLRVLHLRSVRTLQEAVGLADAAPDAILVVAEDGSIVLANARVTSLLGYSPAELIGRSVETLVPAPMRDAHRENRARFHAAPVARPMGDRPLQALRSDGTHVPVAISLSTARYGGRSVTICFLRDVTEARRIRFELPEANAELKRGMAVLEAQSRALRDLERASELLQCCASETEVHMLLARWAQRLATGISGTLHMHVGCGDRVERTQAWGMAAVAALPAHFPVHQCWALRRGRAHRSGDPEHGASCAHGNPAGDGSPFTCIPLSAQGEVLGVLTASAPAGNQAEFQDNLLHSLADRAAVAIANLRLRDALWKQSVTDPLTGLHNRRHFEDALARAMDEARHGERTVSLLLIDMDHFKRLNDGWGHAAGDEALRLLADQVRALLRDGDVAARLGGDEFAVLLQDANRADAAAFAERLVAALKQPGTRSREGMPPRPSVSVGIAVAPDDARDASALMHRADEQLYAAKHAGRERSVVRL